MAPISYQVIKKCVLVCMFTLYCLSLIFLCLSKWIFIHQDDVHRRETNFNAEKLMCAQQSFNKKENETFSSSYRYTHFSKHFIIICLYYGRVYTFILYTCFTCNLSHSLPWRRRRRFPFLYLFII